MPAGAVEHALAARDGKRLTSWRHSVPPQCERIMACWAPLAPLGNVAQQAGAAARPTTHARWLNATREQPMNPRPPGNKRLIEEVPPAFT